MTYLVFRLVYLEPGTASLVFVVCSYNSLHVATFVCQALNSVFGKWDGVFGILDDLYSYIAIRSLG